MSLFIFTAVSCTGNRLEMNYHSADISTNEDEHVVLAGFAARKGLSDGIHQHLYTHCLTLKDSQGQKICIISNDLMEISPMLSDTIRTMIAERSGIARENILMHNIHTHSAPRCGGASIQTGGTNRAWKLRMMETVISNAVKTITSDDEYLPFTLETAQSETSININRCEADGPVDHDVLLARFTPEGKTPVTFINLACHPVCMGPSSKALSSDYPGVCAKALKEYWGDGEIVFLTGAAGNMNPERGPRDAAHAEECGKALAENLRDVEFTPVKSTGLLRIVNETVDLPYQKAHITAEAVRQHADSLSLLSSSVSASFGDDVRGWEKEILARFAAGPVADKLRYSLHVVDIDGIMFLFSDGEPFCEYQQEARAAFPEKTIFFAGYTNGQNSYLPSAHAYEVRKGYEYETEQMHIYIKAPYPLSPKAPAFYSAGVKKILEDAIAAESSAPQRDWRLYSIVPQPASLEQFPGDFTLSAKTAIKIEDASLAESAQVFLQRVKTATGFDLEKGSGKGSEIVLRHVEGLGDEEYRLEVSEKQVLVEATTPAGAFYALQSLTQLLPAQICSTGKVSGVNWTAPCCRIADHPALPYRSMMIDCGRYFYPKEDIMKFIDQMSLRKINKFHWHLTEDQGWRIEIKKYPLLTEIGSKRPFTADYNDANPDGTPHEGYYSQDDIREVVEYARLRQVEVVPEIEIPGHSSAALAAYPQFSCDTTKTYQVATSWGVKDDVYSPSDATLTFLEDVFTEMLPLFPSEYWHIGGDECPQKAWKESPYVHAIMREKGLKDYDEIQSYFVNRICAFLRAHGKQVIGWDEILDGKAVDQNMIAQSYRGHGPAAKGIKRGHRVILSPDRWCYFNYYQKGPDFEPKTQPRLLTLKKIGNYYPSVDSLLDLSKQYIIGVEACLWGEYIPDSKSLEYWTYPRMSELGESGWTLRENKDWWSLRWRMVKEMDRLEAAGVEGSDTFWTVVFDFDSVHLPRPVSADMLLAYPGAAIHYTTDGSEPDASSPVFISAFTPEKGTTVKAQGFKPNGEKVGKVAEITF